MDIFLTYGSKGLSWLQSICTNVERLTWRYQLCDLRGIPQPHLGYVPGIVDVQVLGGDAINAWIHRKSNAFKDSLPRQIPDARPMTLG